MQKKLQRRKDAIEKKTINVVNLDDFKKNIDSLSEVEIKVRHHNKKRSKKLRVKIPA